MEPDVAVFGKKDYQQWRVICRMVRDLDFDVEVVGIETGRELDGMAMSSRNALLTPENRQKAICISQALQVRVKLRCMLLLVSCSAGSVSLRRKCAYEMHHRSCCQKGCVSNCTAVAGQHLRHDFCCTGLYQHNGSCVIDTLCMGVHCTDWGFLPTSVVVPAVGSGHNFAGNAITHEHPA